MYMYLGTQNIELAAAKCDISQEPMSITDSSNYYSTIKIQHCTKQVSNSSVVYKVSKNFIMHTYVYKCLYKSSHVFVLQNRVSDYETPLSTVGYEDSKGPNPYSVTKGKNYSKVAGNDYEAIHNTDEYASALQVYSNNVRESTNNDDTIVSEYSEVEDADSTTANDEEEIYSDPGHSEADIYACFEQKKFRMIKRDAVRWVTYIAVASQLASYVCAVQ